MNYDKCCIPVHCIFPDHSQFEDEAKLDKDAGRRGHEDFLDDVVFVDGTSVFAPIEGVVPNVVPRQLFGGQAVQCVGNRCLEELKTLYLSILTWTRQCSRG